MASRGWERDDDSEITRRREEGTATLSGGVGGASQDADPDAPDGGAVTEKVVKKRRNILTENNLVSAEGLPKIYKTFPYQVSSDVTGQEVRFVLYICVICVAVLLVSECYIACVQAKALGSLMRMYKQWAYDLYPGLNFEDFVDRAEALGKGHGVR